MAKASSRTETFIELQNCVIFYRGIGRLQSAKTEDSLLGEVIKKNKQ